MKNNAYFKNLYRTIFSTKARFFSIFIIVFLGASFYAGLRQTSPIMHESINQFLEEHYFQDIEMISTFGYDEADIEAVRNLDYVDKVDSGYRFDVLIQGEEIYGATVFTTDDFESINSPNVLEGRLPKKADEILLDHRFVKYNYFQLGDTLILESDYASKEYIVVGIVSDTRYICDTERGTNSLGNGTNTGYIIMPSTGNEDIAVDSALFDLRDSEKVYTEIRVLLNRDQEYSYFESDYEDYVDGYREELEAFVESRHDDVYQQVKSEAYKEIDDGEKEYNDGLSEYEDGLDEYNQGLIEYEDGLKEYNEGVASFNEQISDGQAQLDAAQKELDEASATLSENKTAVDEGIKQSNDGLKTISSQLDVLIESFSQSIELDEFSAKVMATGDESLINDYTKLLTSLNDYNEVTVNFVSQLTKLKTTIEGITIQHNDTTSFRQLDSAISLLDEIINECSGLDDSLTVINSSAQDFTYSLIFNYPDLLSEFTTLAKSFSDSDFSELIDGLETLQFSLGEIEEGLDGIKSYDDGYNEYLAGVSALEDATKEFNQQKAQGEALLADSKKQLDDAKKQLDEAQIELADAKVELEKARTKLDNAKEDVEKIEKTEIISLTTKENAGIISYESNCDAMNSISIIFPLIFFLVAALVALTTMTRMVEEQRIQNGTLRALGYEKYQVIIQYLIYAFLATFFACGLGIAFGTVFFPSVIYYLYASMMFDVGASTRIIYDLATTLQTYGISVAIILIVTWLVCYSSMNESAASLLRPKAPKIGKRIFLERITFIWRRLSFNQKVTMRNIFRYKRRFFMSVIGIAGCTALIITGFGITYSISNLADKQYGEVFYYNEEVAYDDDMTSSEALAIEKQMQESPLVKGSVSTYTKTIEAKDKENVSYAPYIEVTRSLDDYSGIASLNDIHSNEPLELKDDGVYIDLKFAQLMDIDAGDSFIINIDNHDYEVKVNGVFTLYFYHYVIMSEDYYTTLTGDEILYNTAHVYLDESIDGYQDKFIDFSKDIAGIDSISNTKDFAATFDSMMTSLNSVVIILIVCAALLAFVVLYNLTNINIQERKSEIATIKVLGFYNKEVYDYVFRENIFLAVIGSLLGIVGGYFLHGYLINVVEVDLAHFVHFAGLSSYIYAIILTLLFTYVIDFIMRRVLNKIDMVESLKSIE